MNAMSRTIKVRRANNNTAAIGKHLTLTNVKNEADSMFAFGMTDEGEEVYIPANIVRAQQMTEADIGAGLTCPLRPNPRANAEANNPPYVAIHPVKWDGEPELVEVDDLPEGDVSQIAQEDWDELVEALADLTEIEGAISDLTDVGVKLEAQVRDMKKNLDGIVGALAKAKVALNDLAPEINE